MPARGAGRVGNTYISTNRIRSQADLSYVRHFNPLGHQPDRLVTDQLTIAKLTHRLRPGYQAAQLDEAVALCLRAYANGGMINLGV